MQPRWQEVHSENRSPLNSKQINKIILGSHFGEDSLGTVI